MIRHGPSLMSAFLGRHSDAPDPAADLGSGVVGDDGRRRERRTFAPAEWSMNTVCPRNAPDRHGQRRSRRRARGESGEPGREVERPGWSRWVRVWHPDGAGMI
jgi:hypothetical protein